MQPFRFRAAAALALRRAQEDRAATALARVEADFRAAQDACAAMEASRTRAEHERLAQTGRGIDIAALHWHRNWIIRVQVSIEHLRKDVRTRAEVVNHAEQAWRLAKRRRLALDRMRERSLARYRSDERRQEGKAIDELARLRFTMPDAAWEE